ncbi:MAG: hypothetical protein H0T42_00505 [Deltaproteobacteria bacterium]|nr:hypothetical protein [Deltaproteobacteria bacterium]
MRRCSLVLALVALSACPKAGGSYAQGDRSAGDIDRGETQGRMFDFVSNKPEGDDWQVRIRGSSLWASYSNEESTDELGTRNLSKKEAAKVWTLIDALELADRKKGRKDEDDGYVYLRLREPGQDEGYDFFEAYVSRETEDEAVIDLAEYLRDLITKYHKEKPNF